MALTGVFANALGILIGAMLGTVLGTKIPKRICESLIVALGLSAFVMVGRGVMDGENINITMISLVVGTIIGELLDLDGKVNRLGDRIQTVAVKKLSGLANERFSEGFVVSSVMLCIGPIAIMGAINSGTMHDYSLYFMKMFADGAFAVIFAATMGIGVAFSSLSIILIEGVMVLASTWAQPFLEAACGEMNVVGCVMLGGMAINMLQIREVKVMNMIPAVLIPIILCQFM